MHFFDSHLHLQDRCFKESIESVMERAALAGVAYMVCCGTAPDDWEAVALLARQYPSIIPSFGVHPWSIACAGDTWQQQLEKYLMSSPSGIGEIGLDFTDPTLDRQLQERIFAEQLAMAHRMHRPVSIHCRKAWDRMAAIMEPFRSFPAGGVMHSFSGSVQTMEFFLKRGLAVSVSGAVTNSHNRKLPGVVAAVPDTMLLLETDSPAIVPYTIENRASVPFNEPARIACIAQAVAVCRSVDLETIAGMTYENGSRLYKNYIHSGGVPGHQH